MFIKIYFIKRINNNRRRFLGINEYVFKFVSIKITNNENVSNINEFFN